MTRITLTTALLVFAALTMLTNVAEAVRIKGQHHDAHELRLGDVNLPGSPAGTVVFKTCSSCKTESMRVMDTTVYQVDGRMVTFKDFTAAAQALRKRQGGTSKTIVYVIFETQSRRVSRLGISYLGQ